MKQLLCILSLLLLGENAFAQPSYFLLDDKSSMHFVGLSYGFGTTGWRSNLENYDLIDQYGVVLVSGDGSFRVQNRQESVHLETLVPLSQGKWRAGLGLTFEEFSVYEIDVEASLGNIAATKPFAERFRFDKVFGQVEVPLPILENPFVSFNANVRGGWYGFSSVGSSSLFGEERIGRSWFGGLGLLCDVMVYDRVYLVVMPYAEYKYFSNAPKSVTGNIYHKMLGTNLLIGARVHLL